MNSRHIMRCAVGDLAIIEHSEFPQNVGLIVEVLRPHFAPIGRPPMWLVRIATKDAQAMVGTPAGDFPAGKTGFIEDWRLKPIRGQQQPEALSTAADQPQTVEA